MSMPVRITVADKGYVAAVLRIESRFDDGTPEILRLVKPDQTVELDHNDQSKNCFLVGWISDMDHSKYAGQIPTL